MNVLLRLAYSQVGGAQYRRIGFNLPQQRTRQSVDNRIMAVQVNEYFNRASTTTEIAPIQTYISITYGYYPDFISLAAPGWSRRIADPAGDNFDTSALSGRADAGLARARARNKLYLSVSYG